MVHEGGKAGRSNATPNKLFFVDSFDLRFMSFKFGNDIFIIYEMPRSSLLISMLFRPSASEVLDSAHHLELLGKVD